MATWPSGTKASTINLDAGTDSPASARADLKQNTDNVNSIIDMFNITSPSNDQILKYNTSNSRFELGTAGGGALNEFVITLNSSTATNISGQNYQFGLTETFDANNLLSISSNEFTLAAGNYIATLLKPAGLNSNSSSISLSLRNMTDSLNEWQMEGTNLTITGTRCVIFPQSQFWNIASSTLYQIRGVAESGAGANLYNNVQFLFRKLS